MVTPKGPLRNLTDTPATTLLCHAEANLMGVFRGPKGLPQRGLIHARTASLAWTFKA